MNLKTIKNAIIHLSEAKQAKIEKAVRSKVEQGFLYEETHLHSKDQFKADNDPKKVISRYKELNRSAIYLTQYGVAAMTWDFKTLAESEGMKFIPGLETDYQSTAQKNEKGLMIPDATEPVSKLVLHALDDQGWKAIGMAMSDSQTEDGKTILSDDTLKAYFGKGSVGHEHVVATTAGVNGPVAQIFKESSLAEEAVANIIKTRDRKTGGEVPDFYLEKLEAKISELTNELGDLKEVIQTTKKLAKVDFSKLEKSIEKIKNAKGETSTEFIEAYLKMSESRKESKMAESELVELGFEQKRLMRRIAALKKELKAFQAIQEENAVYQDEIDEVNAKITPMDAMEEKAEKKLLMLNDLFGQGFFYVEIHNHLSLEQKRILPKLVLLARKNNIPLIAANDVHMIDSSEEEVLKRQILKTTEEPDNPKWFELSPAELEMYIKTDEEMKTVLSQLFEDDVVEEAMLNTLVLTELCDLKFEVVNHHPKFVDSTGRDSNEIFLDLIQDGISKKFPNGLDEEHQKRLDHEIHIMQSMGYVDYHLVVNDFNQYASEYDAIPFEKIPEAPLDREALKEWKEQNGYTTPVGLTNGTGRGSAVGSLVCDLLNITHLDPMRYELLFERFLNPERVSMPDIDSDISRTVRPIVIEYVKHKYGHDCVAGIITQNSQAPKGAIRISAKAYGLYLNRKNPRDNGAKQFLDLGDKIAKTVPNTPGTSFATKMADDEDTPTVYEFLLSEFKEDDNAVEIIKWASVFENCFTAYGSHAAGIVITDGTPVSEIVPLRWNDKLGLYTTQCDMVVAEEIGMLKFDMLGLKTVDIINDTLWEANKSGVLMDTNNLPLDDAAVYSNIFASGKTDSVFQFESNGMKQMLKRFQPENFEDLIILVSMYRPGPLQYLDDVIDVKHGRKPLTFLTPELEPILGATYGAITYQEQVMQIFQQLAGYTLGGADLVRRFMSKKKGDKLAQEKEAFIHGDSARGIVGCVANGIDAKAAGQLFDQMTEFAKYAFNKSHAAAYAYNAYITGYLKYHYPAEFMMSAMRWAEKQGDNDPIPGLMAEAKSMGIEVYPPDINHSGENFNVENGRILFGLGSVASVASFGKEIVEERKNGKYVDFFDYFKRTKAKKDATKNLILAGAFDNFHSNRKAMVEVVDEIKTISQKVKEKRRFIEVAEAMLPFVDELTTEKQIIDRQKELKLRVELKKPTTHKKLSQRISNAYKALESLSELFDNVTFPTDMVEDLSERMNAERKLIGAYITSHPMDGYEPGSSLNIAPLSEIDEQTTQVYGLISQLDIKRRKKDNKPMAFMIVEDKIGSVKVNVFTEDYAKNATVIQQSAVVIITGYTKAKELEEEGSTKIVYEFIAKSISFGKKKQCGLYMAVNSLALFHLDEEEFFRNKYESPVGVPLQIYDCFLNEVRLMNYKVSLQATEDSRVIQL